MTRIHGRRVGWRTPPVTEAHVPFNVPVIGSDRGPHPTGRSTPMTLGDLDPTTLRTDRVYAIPALYRILSWAVVALLVGVAVACAAVPWWMPGHLGWLYAAYLGAVVSGGLSILSITATLRLRFRFTVEERGLVRVDPDGGRALLPWDRIERLRQRPFLQCLDVLDRNGDVIARLEYQLDGFDELVEEIIRRVPAAATVATPVRGSSRGVVFGGRRAWHAHFPVVISVGVLAASWYWAGGIIIGAWVFAIVFLGLWLWGWRRIRVGPAGITVEALVRSRHIPAARILSVDMVTHSDRGNRSLVVVITLVDGSVLAVSGCPEGDLALYRAVSAIHAEAGPTGGRP